MAAFAVSGRHGQVERKQRRRAGTTGNSEIGEKLGARERGNRGEREGNRPGPAVEAVPRRRARDLSEMATGEAALAVDVGGMETGEPAVAATGEPAVSDGRSGGRVRV